MGTQLEGKNPVYEALRANRLLNGIMISRDVEHSPMTKDIISLARANNVPVEIVKADEIRKKSMTKYPQGIIAFTPAKGYTEFDELLKIPAQKNEPAFFVMLDQIEDPHNLGAILRSVDASGAHGVILPERRAVGISPTVAKVSAGAVEYVPVTKVNNLNNAIRELKQEGIMVIGVEDNEKQNFYDLDLKIPLVLVIGSEGQGISRLVKENCDVVASLPMKGGVSSLNASVAAGIAMFETLRQRLAQ